MSHFVKIEKCGTSLSHTNDETQRQRQLREMIVNLANCVVFPEICVYESKKKTRKILAFGIRYV